MTTQIEISSAKIMSATLRRRADSAYRIAEKARGVLDPRVQREISSAASYMDFVAEQFEQALTQPTG